MRRFFNTLYWGGSVMFSSSIALVLSLSILFPKTFNSEYSVYILIVPVFIISFFISFLIEDEWCFFSFFWSVPISVVGYLAKQFPQIPTSLLFLIFLLCSIIVPLLLKEQSRALIALSKKI